MDPVAPLLVAAAAFGGYVGFFRKRRRLNDAPTVEAAWRASYPGDEIRDSVVSTDGRAGLVETSWGAGLVCRGGTVARRLDGAEAELDSGGLLIRLPDLDPPRIHLALEPGAAALWQERIERE